VCYLCVTNFLFVILPVLPSLNHSMAPEVGRDLPKQGHLKPSAQDHVQMASEYSQELRLHNLSGQSAPILGHCHSKKCFCWCSEGTSCVSVWGHCLLSCHWTTLKRVSSALVHVITNLQIYYELLNKLPLLLFVTYTVITPNGHLTLHA